MIDAIGTESTFVEESLLRAGKITEVEWREEEEGIGAMEEDKEDGTEIRGVEEAAPFEVVAKDCKVLGFRR